MLICLLLRYFHYYAIIYAIDYIYLSPSFISSLFIFDAIFLFILMPLFSCFH